jgi:pimeloyl-ACP methyl ester carboxylesterase
MTTEKICKSSFLSLFWKVLLLSSACFRHDGAVLVVSAYTPASSPDFRRRGTARFASSPSVLSSSEKASSVSEQLWEFQGHQCYAEIARPDLSALLPATKAIDVLKGLGTKKSKRPEIVLIHGFGCSSTYWRETTKALTKAGYSVHALDLLGQGKSAKPGRPENVEYSINLWAKMVEDYTTKFIPRQNRVVLMGNSLGSVVALSAATGDHAGDDKTKGEATLPSRIQGIGMFNCGVGMNSRNLLKDPNLNSFQRVLFTFLFDTLDKLIFDNVPLLTYLLKDVVTRDLLRNALLGLYQCSPNPELRVDDALVESFYLPAKDAGSVDALNQIYTNDAGKTPMQLHEDYADFLKKTPLHLVWGTQDGVTPFAGPVGQFYVDLAKNPEEPVSISVVEGGHIPFDEIPECNNLMVQWLEDVVLFCEGDKETGSFLPWPFQEKSPVP